MQGRSIHVGPAAEAHAMVAVAAAEGLQAVEVEADALAAALATAAAALEAGDLLVLTVTGELATRLGPLLRPFRRGVRIFAITDDALLACELLLPTIDATLLWLSARPDAVLAAWRGGAFRGGHRAFAHAVTARDPDARLVRAGPIDLGFERSRPFTVEPAPAAFTPPLAVHLCWYTGAAADPTCAAIARELYELLHRPLDDDPVHRPGLEIPVDYGRDLVGLLDAIELPAYDDRRERAVGARVVVVVLDRAGFASKAFRAAVARAVARLPAGALVPIVLSEAWHDVLGDVRGPRLGAEGGRRWQLASEVALRVGHALLGAAAPPEVFISHARVDGRATAAALAAHFRNQTAFVVHYDERAVGRGDELVDRLEQAGGRAVLLAIRSDRYAESPWCGLELLAAKQARVPMVTVLDGHDGEHAMSAYGGNHRALQWRDGRAWEVVARCVQAWLHRHYFAAHAAVALAHAGLPCDAEIVAHHPELLDLASSAGSSGRRIIVYPDPPLIEREAALLRAAHPSVRLVTPNTMLGKVLLANDPSPPLAGCTIACSLSFAEDRRVLGPAIDGSGLTHTHLGDVLSTIVLTALQTGARIGYGGDFRATEGYAVTLSELHRARRRLGTGRGSQLTCFVEDEVDSGDGEVEHWPVSVRAPDGAERWPGPVRDALWRMAMRDRMAADCDARVVLGGQTRAATTPEGAGYRGPWPGVLEEAWRTIAAGKALYLIGALGGIGGLLCRMLVDDAVPPELTAAALAGTPTAALAAQLDDARRALTAAPSLLLLDGGELLGREQMAGRLLDRWRAFCAGDAAAWRNGLGVGDNRRLFRSTDRTEIAQLVFAGLRQISRQPTDALKLALYHGDIASAAGVDGYAVTATPGLRHGGAIGALDRRAGGRVGDVARHARHEVESATLAADGLAGGAVLVARLPLPPPGAPIEVAGVEELAARVARKADELGVQSLAIVPFGASIGLDAVEAVQAVIRGVRRGRGVLPRTLVVCEADRARYDAIRAALDGVASELRAGPRPTSAVDTIVLQVDASRAELGAAVTVRTTVYATDGGSPVVPRHEVTLEPATWDALRARPGRFNMSIALGQHLQQQLLSPAMVVLLARHVDRRLLLITNDLASGLPWELLSSSADASPAIGAGLVRRIAMAGPAPRADERASGEALLRVLLIVDPRGDLTGATAEGDAVEAALRGRPDVTVTILRGLDATRAQVGAALASGRHDVLHYAGHAYFKPADPGRSGLHLADGTFTAADLGATAPRLVILGGCESARVRAEAIPDAPRPDDQPLAEALLRIGVTTMVGTFFPVLDDAARRFARTLYTTLVAGRPIGDAVRDARRALHAHGATDWGNFLLYGDDGLIL